MTLFIRADAWFPFRSQAKRFSRLLKARFTGRTQSALLVADLHLEKASWFARLGQFLPPYDLHATLTRACRRGRSGPARTGCSALATASTTASAATACRPTLARCSSELTGRSTGRGSSATTTRALPTIAAAAWRRRSSLPASCFATKRCGATRGRKSPGHFHPKLRLHLKGRQVSRRCFVAVGDAS